MPLSQPVHRCDTLRVKGKGFAVAFRRCVQLVAFLMFPRLQQPFRQRFRFAHWLLRQTDMRRRLIAVVGDNLLVSRVPCPVSLDNQSDLQNGSFAILDDDGNRLIVSQPDGESHRFACRQGKASSFQNLLALRNRDGGVVNGHEGKQSQVKLVARSFCVERDGVGSVNDTAKPPDGKPSLAPSLNGSRRHQAVDALMDEATALDFAIGFALVAQQPYPPSTVFRCAPCPKFATLDFKPVGVMQNAVVKLLVVAAKPIGSQILCKQVSWSLVGHIEAQIRAVLNREVGNTASAPPPRKHLRAREQKPEILTGSYADIRPKVNAMPKRRSVKKPDAGVQAPIVRS